MAYAETLADLFRLEAEFIWANVSYTVQCSTTYIVDGIVHYGGWVISMGGI